MTETQDLPVGEKGMSATWRDLALNLRAALREADIDLGDCLPGEEGFCGADYANHCYSYGAAIAAYGEYVLYHLHHDDPYMKRKSQGLVQHWRKEFDRQRGDCVPCREE